MGDDTPQISTRARKILRRTLVGGSIALLTAGLLYFVRGESGPLIVHGFAAVLLLGSIFEASRMSEDIRRAAWSLGAAGVMGWALTFGLLEERGLAQLDLGLLLQLLCASASMALVASAVSPALSRRFGVAVILPLSCVAYWFISNAPGRQLVSMTLSLVLLLALMGARPSPARQLFRDVLKDVSRAVWFVPALIGLALLHARFGQPGLISLIVLSKVGDVFGYFGGSLFGKHHPLPSLSPGKTTEGFACSLLGGVGVGVALAHWGVLPGEDPSLFAGALIGGIMNVAAQAGDLLESWVKRRAGVKDSGSTFGPSGGFLDLLDSFFLTVPVALVIGLLTGA